MFKETDVEIWKDVVGFEGQYAVSSKGNIKNIKTGRILVGAYDSGGYKYVILKGKTCRVHRLLALAFIPNPQNLPYINHRDENKRNNDISNLEWCSALYNANYSSHKQCCQVKQIDKNGNLIKVWSSFSQINKELGYNIGAIVKACRGKLRYAYNFRWEYMNPSSQRTINRPVIVHRGDEYIGTFPSIKKASEELGLRYGSVYECLRGRHTTHKGYIFKYVE